MKRRRLALCGLVLLGCLSVGGLSLFTSMGKPIRDWLAPWLEKDAEEIPSSTAPTSLSPDANALATAALQELNPHALPIGLTSFDSEAGQGLERTVKVHGLWFPVYDPEQSATHGRPVLNLISLAIASGPAPLGVVNEPYRYQSAAIGGTPPYHWEASISPGAAFTFEASGLLTGLSSAPLAATLKLIVTDADGTQASVQMPLIILPTQALAILTHELPLQTMEAPLELALSAGGGVPPYRWGSLGALPTGVTVNTDGLISGMPKEAGEFPILFLLTDSQAAEVRKELLFKVASSLEIITDAALPPVTPGSHYELTFEVTGGVEPYTWELTRGDFPQGSARLEPSGRLSGEVSNHEELATFTLTVRDATEATYEKTFHLAVSHLLIAIPSAQKVGLAWSLTDAQSLLRSSGLAAQSFVVLRDDEIIYEGDGNNFVDHQRPVGSTPKYDLAAVLDEGDLQMLATQQVEILPMSRERGVAGVRADPYADLVTAYHPLAANAYGSTQLPRNVTGPPDGHSSFAPANRATEVASLGATSSSGGFLELAFTDNILELAPGEDLTVFENVFFIGGNAAQRFMEPAIISVALFPGEWHRLPCDVLPPIDGTPINTRNPFYYARGLAGRNATTGEDPTDPSRSGGDSFDLDPSLAGTGLTWIRYVRIQSTGDAWLTDDFGHDPIRHDADPLFRPLSGTGASGFDLDAICALHELAH